MAASVSGIISVLVFYLIILAIGIYAGRKRSPKNGDKQISKEEDIMVAGRNIGTFVGIFTMTATWVGGGYINGTAEETYKNGLLWCQAPFGYALSLIIGKIIKSKSGFI